MFIALRKPDFTRGVKGVEAGYYDYKKHKPVNCGRVVWGAALEIDDKIGGLILEQNGAIFMQVKKPQDAPKVFEQPTKTMININAEKVITLIGLLGYTATVQTLNSVLDEVITDLANKDEKQPDPGADINSEKVIDEPDDWNDVDVKLSRDELAEMPVNAINNLIRDLIAAKELDEKTPAVTVKKEDRITFFLKLQDK